MCHCYCVSLQPTCLVDQGEPRSILLSGQHRFFTRISVTLKLCRRLLSGQYGSDVVVVVLCVCVGGVVLVPFMAPQVEVGGGGLSVHRGYLYIPPIPECSSFTCIDHTAATAHTVFTGRRKTCLFSLFSSLCLLLCCTTTFFILGNACNISTAGAPVLPCMEPAVWLRRLTSSSEGDHWGTLASPTTRTARSRCPARPDTDSWSTG